MTNCYFNYQINTKSTELYCKQWTRLLNIEITVIGVSNDIVYF